MGQINDNKIKVYQLLHCYFCKTVWNIFISSFQLSRPIWRLSFFLDECYEAEHLLSIEDAINDIAIICKNNGGQLE